MDAFMGTFEGVRQELDSAGTRRGPFYHWHVVQTVSGPQLRENYRFDGVSCHPLTFTEGTRYLIAIRANPQNIDAFSTVAWRLVGGGEARLVGFEVDPSVYPDVFQVTTLAEALALFEPGLPPTDSVATIRDDRAGFFLPLVLVGALAVGAWLTLRLRSRWFALGSPNSEG